MDAMVTQLCGKIVGEAGVSMGIRAQGSFGCAELQHDAVDVLVRRVAHGMNARLDAPLVVDGRGICLAAGVWELIGDCEMECG
jgi:hypothetical protein